MILAQCGNSSSEMQWKSTYFQILTVVKNHSFQKSNQKDVRRIVVMSPSVKCKYFPHNSMENWHFS